MPKNKEQMYKKKMGNLCYRKPAETILWQYYDKPLQQSPGKAVATCSCFELLRRKHKTYYNKNYYLYMQT